MPTENGFLTESTRIWVQGGIDAGDEGAALAKDLCGQGFHLLSPVIIFVHMILPLAICCTSTDGKPIFATRSDTSIRFAQHALDSISHGPTLR